MLVFFTSVMVALAMRSLEISDEETGVLIAFFMGVLFLLIMAAYTLFMLVTNVRSFLNKILRPIGIALLYAMVYLVFGIMSVYFYDMEIWDNAALWFLPAIVLSCSYELTLAARPEFAESSFVVFMSSYILAGMVTLVLWL